MAGLSDKELLARIGRLKETNPDNLAVASFELSYYDSLPPAEQQGLLRCVRSGVEFPDSSIGCYACQPEDLSAECEVARNSTGGIVDRGNDKPGCHWYLQENVTTPWVDQTGLPGAGSEFACALRPVAASVATWACSRCCLWIRPLAYRWVLTC